jgi:putative salt-induced outer membrane protein
MLSLLRVIAVSSLVLGSFASQVVAEEAPADPWKSSVELGAIINRGNSDNASYQARAESAYEIEKWRHAAVLEVTGAEESGETTKERYLGTFDTNYKYTARDYVFGALRLERDRFSGFEYQNSLSAGYGRRIIDSKKHRLDGEIGPGVRHSKPEGGSSDSEVIGRAKGAYRYTISETSVFNQDVLVLAGESNTEVESVTALKLKINAALGLRFSYRVKYNTDPPAGTDDTDTTLAVNLLYEF